MKAVCDSTYGSNDVVAKRALARQLRGEAKRSLGFVPKRVERCPRFTGVDDLLQRIPAAASEKRKNTRGVDRVVDPDLVNGVIKGQRTEAEKLFGYALKLVSKPKTLIRTSDGGYSVILSDPRRGDLLEIKGFSDGDFADRLPTTVRLHNPRSNEVAGIQIPSKATNAHNFGFLREVDVSGGGVPAKFCRMWFSDKPDQAAVSFRKAGERYRKDFYFVDS